MCEWDFFPAALQKKLQWKDIKNTNEKGMLLTCMLNIKLLLPRGPESSSYKSQFLQSLVFALDGQIPGAKRRTVLTFQQNLKSNLPTLSASSVCSSKVGLSVYKRRVDHKSPLSLMAKVVLLFARRGVWEFAMMG